MVISKIQDFNLTNKTCFLRVDLNTPIINGKLFSDFKIQAILPTLNLLLSKHCSIILATHIGRPEGFDKNLSTEIFISWFEKNKYNIIFCPDLNQAQAQAENLKPGQILLLENLRFYPEEKSCDINFARKLKDLAEFYINDAFGLLHRHDCSITELPKLYSEQHKTVGLLIQKEISVLSKIRDNPAKPFTIIQGGAKVADKIPFLEHLIDKIDNLIIGPAISFTFLKALKKETGLSLVEENSISKALEVLNLAKEKQVNLLLPEDYVVYKNNKLSVTDNIDSDAVGITIGPKTLDNIKNIIDNSKTVFLNGTMGLQDKPETLKNFLQILEYIANSKTYSVIGGGDTVSLVYNYGLENKINFCSTGGGATLLFLSGQDLPGLKYLN